PSLHKLTKAYRGLRIDDFERFLTFFREAGYDLDARDAKGNDFVALVADQRQARLDVTLGVPLAQRDAQAPVGMQDGAQALFEGFAEGGA
ncbi:PA4642 family protein, partial [Klebsiella pneumoniae]|uniref:PA4642 family protein n=1 Tax=Klebsiella pneumoniae TaxID=573 RepID=UPI00396A957B